MVSCGFRCGAQQRECTLKRARSWASSGSQRRDSRPLPLALNIGGIRTCDGRVHGPSRIECSPYWRRSAGCSAEDLRRCGRRRSNGVPADGRRGRPRPPGAGSAERGLPGGCPAGRMQRCAAGHRTSARGEGASRPSLAIIVDWNREPSVVLSSRDGLRSRGLPAACARTRRRRGRRASPLASQQTWRRDAASMRRSAVSPA